MKEDFDEILFIQRGGSVGSNNAKKVQININSEIKDNQSLKEVSEIFEFEGKALAETLLKYLPGGTVDVLLQELLKNKASMFIIPFK